VGRFWGRDPTTSTCGSTISTSTQQGWDGGELYGTEMHRVPKRATRWVSTEGGAGWADEGLLPP
jgi:hypothetical protein